MKTDQRPIAVDIRAELAHSRSLVYGLLARFLRRPPDRELVAHLRSPGVFRDLLDAGMDLDQDELFGESSEEVLEMLTQDYSALFDAPPERIHLNESIYRSEDGFLMGESTLQVKTFIESLGLEIENRRSELADHLAVELEIMQRMVEAEGVLWDTHELAAARACRTRQRAFLEDHLDRWAPRVCKAIERRARTTLYRELARLTAAFLGQEARGLAEPRG